MDANAIGVPNYRSSATREPAANMQRTARAATPAHAPRVPALDVDSGKEAGLRAVPTQVPQGSALNAGPGRGIVLRDQVEAIGPREKIDQHLEDFKRIVLNEIELDFSWYCRDKSRPRREMEEWWEERRELVDALREDAWPAWGTEGAFKRCERLVRLGDGKKGRPPQRGVEPARSRPRKA